MRNIIISIKAFILFSILLGLVYPLTITGIAQLTMPQKANGSLITQNGQIVGSNLIGQNFDKPEYFNSRPSAVGYNAFGSGASNFGPTNKKFIENVQARIKKIKQVDNIKDNIPADMVLASASGLDPHISTENAEIQATRVAKIRKVSREKINQLIGENTDTNFLGLWGKRGVNVLKLNMALDNVSLSAQQNE